MFIKKTKARTYSVSFLSDKKCKAMREYFSWGQKDKLARRRNLLAPWSLLVRQNIHSTCSIDDDVDDVDDDYGDEFDLDIYIMMKCMCVTKNHHFLLGVSCNHPGWFFMVLGRFLWFFMVLGQVL